ncbi:MORN repeat-containing protein 3-like isoform X2 [Amphibalanus amphitrite]|uniref:MORN repeat-containing protein 3-like isoform X2 n=1 Tax=Amphibalanus amphitrite TaxID=1232801 RepID=UPI001C908A07|nr:MORN repeat-containing protein 3-like isoform X2 [Amphibalanus amphitrite]
MSNDQKALKNGPRGKIFIHSGTYKGDWLNDLKHVRNCSNRKGHFRVVERRDLQRRLGVEPAPRVRRLHGTVPPNLPADPVQRTVVLRQETAGVTPQGHGVQFYADGESYEGDWHNNKRRGWGRMFYKDGSLYEGEWHDDIREGRGLLRKADGNLYEGTWHRDTKHGPGLYQHKRTGQMQEGIWVDGMVKCSAVEDKNRLFASEPTPYPIPLLELLQPVAVLREAAAEFVPLIPEQYRQAAEAASSASSTYSSTSNVASEPGTDSSSDAASSDTSLLQRCQHRHSLERCARDLRDNSE